MHGSTQARRPTTSGVSTKCVKMGFFSFNGTDENGYGYYFGSGLHCYENQYGNITFNIETRDWVVTNPELHLGEMVQVDGSGFYHPDWIGVWHYQVGLTTTIYPAVQVLCTNVPDCQAITPYPTFAPTIYEECECTF